MTLSWSREEQEKLNVWVALLNLENMYGTEESLKKVFERALQFCEPMPVYQQLADVYAKSNKSKVPRGAFHFTRLASPASKYSVCIM